MMGQGLRLVVLVLAGVVVTVAGRVSPSRAMAADRAATLRGSALGADGPVADAEVAVGILGWAPKAGDWVEITSTDDEGNFTFESPPLGPVDVWVRPPDGSWTHGVRMWHPTLKRIQLDARARPTMAGLHAERGAAKLRGIVKSRKGKAIAGAAVAVRGDDDTYVITNANGEFEIQKAENRDGLIVRARGFKDAISQVKLGKKRMVIKLSPAKETTVTVTSPEGVPLSGAYVTLGDPNRVLETTGFSALFPPRARLQGGFTDDEGVARIAWGHTDPKTVATVYAVGYGTARKAVSSGKSVTLAIGLAHPAKATVKIRNQDVSISGVYVGLPHASDGGPDAISALPATEQRGPIIVGISGSDGTCVIPHLPEGLESLRIVGEYKLRAEVDVERVEADGE